MRNMARRIEFSHRARRVQEANVNLEGAEAFISAVSDLKTPKTDRIQYTSIGG